MRKRNSDERGQSLVIIALALVGLFAFLALVIDGGMAFLVRRQMQNAADVTALASTKELGAGGSENEILAMVNAYAERNGVEAPNGVVTAYFINENLVRLPSGNECQIGTCPTGIPIGARGVEVTTTTSWSSFFAGVIGRTELSVSAIAAAILEITGGGGYAIWADSDSCEFCLDWSGSHVMVEGSVHSNHDIKMGGQNNTITGALEYVTDLDVSGSDNTYTLEQTGVLPLPVDYDIDDYAAAAPGPGETGYVVGDLVIPGNGVLNGPYLINGDFTVSGSYVELNGLFYVTGDVLLSGQYISGNFTIVAQGGIDASGSNQNATPYMDDLLFFSNKWYGDPRCTDWAIKVAGSDSTWEGVIFAPYGQIDTSGSTNSTLHGSLIGYTVRLPGSTLNVAFSAESDPGSAPIFLVK